MHLLLLELIKALIDQRLNLRFFVFRLGLSRDLPGLLELGLQHLHQLGILALLPGLLEFRALLINGAIRLQLDQLVAPHLHRDGHKQRQGHQDPHHQNGPPQGAAALGREIQPRAHQHQQQAHQGHRCMGQQRVHQQLMERLLTPGVGHEHRQELKAQQDDQNPTDPAQQAGETGGGEF